MLAPWLFVLTLVSAGQRGEVAESCADEFYRLFHALQTFSGHPLRHHFLGDADGCRKRGFRYYTAEAEYTYDGASWLPEVYFGLCAPAACDAGHVEVSLVPFYLQLLFSSQGVSAEFANLRIQVAELPAMPAAIDLGAGQVALLMLLLIVVLVSVLDFRLPGCIPGARLISLQRHMAKLQEPVAGMLPTVSFVRATATSAVVAYHTFFFKRDLHAVAGMPLLARRVQHVLLLHTSVFSAMSVWLMYRSFQQARAAQDPQLGLFGVCGAWLRWAFARLMGKVKRQGPALCCAFWLFHGWLHTVHQELHSQKSYEARRALCSEWHQLWEPDCWNTFANWGILRDAQLDAMLAVILAVWGVFGDILGPSGVVVLLAVLGRALFSDDLRRENLLWSLPYRRLPEALSALLAAWLLTRRSELPPTTESAETEKVAMSCSPMAPSEPARGTSNFGGSWARLLVALLLAMSTVEIDWRASQGFEKAQLAGQTRQDASLMARWTCAVGFLPLTLATLLVLPMDAPWLHRCARHWFWGPLGNQLSLPVLLVHNVVLQLGEGCVLIGPNWDYPFSWALWLACFGVLLVASWLAALLLHLLVLAPCGELLAGRSPASS